LSVQDVKYYLFKNKKQKNMKTQAVSVAAAARR
jgi:hypothetical protein